MIVNLTVFFAWHVILPGGRLDWPSLAVAVVAAILLVTKKSDVIPVIVASGVAGLLLWTAGLQRAT